MLEEILDFIHNYFVKEVYRGQFRIESGVLVVDFLQNGQHYKIMGSVFNDGVHEYSEDTLHDETFFGEVWAMAVPQAILDIAKEAQDWVDEYGAIVDNPYQSESFGGYSYMKGAGNHAAGGASSQLSWRDKFGSRLNAYRKIS